MFQKYSRTVLFLSLGSIGQLAYTQETNPPIHTETGCLALKVALCATPRSCIFLEPPENFSPQMEVAGCYCEYQGKMLLLLRHPEKPQGNSWCVPGGKLDRGETPLQAVIREVWEETGLPLSEDLLTYCLKVYVRFPKRDFILHLFRTELSEISKTFEIAPTEHSGYRWVAVEEALKMPLIPGGSDCIRLAMYEEIRTR